MQPRIDRRTLLTIGMASSLYTIGGFRGHAALPDSPIALQPFAHSRTVTSFAKELLFQRDDMPRALRQAMTVGLERTDVVADLPAQERQRAAFLAWVAVRNIAPSALRRAGNEAQAAECEQQVCLSKGMIAAAGAQHAIGKKYAGSGLMPPLASCAYGACAHATTAALYARNGDVAAVAEAGHYCARALLDASFYDAEMVVPNTGWLWNFAAVTINEAVNFLYRPPAPALFAALAR